MTHELKKIIQAYIVADKSGLKTVLATVVALEGSSYRRPGVRMLIREDGKTTGAVSGGCVEKEIIRQADGVFNSSSAKTMTYDGRYRLGCEGVLYILIEPFLPSTTFLEAFINQIEVRESFKIVSYFERLDKSSHTYGSVFFMNKMEYDVRTSFTKNKEIEVFEQQMKPCFKLIIFGSEHDAVQLCSYAALTGWEVDVVASPTEGKEVTDFPGAQKLLHIEPEDYPTVDINKYVAVVLMTHSYVKDLKFLMRIKDSKPAYIGLLGPQQRREKLLNELIENNSDIALSFIENIHGPAGLNIGSETAQEITIAILAEILAVTRNREPILLKNKEGNIH